MNKAVDNRSSSSAPDTPPGGTQKRTYEQIVAESKYDHNKLPFYLRGKPDHAINRWYREEKDYAEKSGRTIRPLPLKSAEELAALLSRARQAAATTTTISSSPSSSNLSAQAPAPAPAPAPQPDASSCAKPAPTNGAAPNTSNGHPSGRGGGSSGRGGASSGRGGGHHHGGTRGRGRHPGNHYRGKGREF
jgi:uncharacterized membrane protein YgcG